MINGLQTLVGEVSVSGTILFKMRNATYVNYMRYNNPSPYVITIEKFSKETNSLSVIYTLNLQGGDTLTDTFAYYLASDEYIKVTSNIAGTKYFVTCQI